MAAQKERICILGSGNWGSAIAKLVGQNVIKHGSLFERTVNMWVHEEKINGVNLTDIINSQHENVKYLPGIKIPENVVAVPNLHHAVENATVLIIVIPHQFVESTCRKLVGYIKPDCKAISLVKGIDATHGLDFFSDIIKNILRIEVSVLMGANVADEVAQGKFCETTIASRNKEDGAIFFKIFDSPFFKVAVIDDTIGTELCGALKNVVALAAGFSDGLHLGGNTKAALIRIGFLEMKLFANTFYSGMGIEDETFLESCGMADLITTCYNGRNRKLAEAFVKFNKSFEELEAEMLNGQKLQGPLTAQEVYLHLQKKNLEKKFPLFTTVYLISFEGLKPTALLDQLINRSAI